MPVPGSFSFLEGLEGEQNPWEQSFPLRLESVGVASGFPGAGRAKGFHGAETATYPSEAFPALNPARNPLQPAGGRVNLPLEKGEGPWCDMCGVSCSARAARTW